MTYRYAGCFPAGEGPCQRKPAVVNTGDAKEIAGSIIDGLQPPNLNGLYRMGAPVRAELARRGYDLMTAQRDNAGDSKTPGDLKLSTARTITPSDHIHRRSHLDHSRGIPGKKIRHSRFV